MKISKFLRSKNLLKSLKAEELKSLNDERQERKDNGNIDSVSVCVADARNDGRGGFTLVELVITIAIVIILSVISVPIYRGYVDKAKWSEAYALLGTILSAQKNYYSEYGYFYNNPTNNGNRNWTGYDSVLNIDIRGNKYFTNFVSWNNGNEGYYFILLKPTELISNNKSEFVLYYGLTSGSYFYEQ